MDVVKRSGRRQKFSLAKLRRGVERAAKDAKKPAKKAKELAAQVAESVRDHLRRKRKVESTDLRKRVLSRLDRRARSVAQAWRRYDRKRR